MSEKKEHLKSMLTNIVHDRDEEAAVDFHNFLKAKMQEIVNPTQAAPAEELNDDNSVVAGDGTNGDE